jgi:predicted GTPase
MVAPEPHPEPPVHIHSPLAEAAHDLALARKDILRIATAGSVDDGKSTLIGRLLYDSKAIFEDQYEAVEAPVTMLRVYCTCPGVSARMNVRRGVLKYR